jgi:hydrogenase nickel incorporation protein HypA/HybF
MHEFSIIQNIFPIVTKIATENHLRTIKEITLKIGKLRQVIPENLQFAFSVLVKETNFKDAKLIIIDVPIEVSCQSCHENFLVNDTAYICPKCGSSDNIILTGKEILLESVIGEK